MSLYDNIMGFCTTFEELVYEWQSLASSPNFVSPDDPTIYTAHDIAHSDRVRKLDSTLKNQFELLFSTDLSTVRIHTGHESNNITRQSNADAVTIGTDIYFANGKFNPESEEGLKLLAHEIQHVVQYQRGDRHEYFEDIDSAEFEAEQAEDTMSLPLLFSMPNVAKTPMPSDNLPNAGFDQSNQDKEVPLNKSTGSSGNSLDSFSGQKEKANVEVILGSGEKIILTRGEYSTLIKQVKENVLGWVSESKFFKTDDEYNELAMKFMKWKNSSN